MNRFDAAVSRWDVARWLRQQGKEIDFTETGQVHFACPYCPGAKKLYISMRTKLWICQRCGRKGGALTLVKLVMKCDDVAAMRLITSSTPVADERYREERKEPPPNVVLPELYHKLVQPEDDKSRPFWDYLTNRGLSADLVSNFEMGYVRAGPLKNRIILPIYQYGQLAGYTARSLFDIKMKYWVPPWCKTSQMLYNIDALEGQEYGVLMEGQFDIYRLPQVSVCTFGKKISAEQVGLMVDSGVTKWVMCYDGNAALEGVKFAARLPEYMEVFKATIPEEYDPGNVPMMTLVRAIQEAEPTNVDDVTEFAARAELARPRRR